MARPRKRENGEGGEGEEIRPEQMTAGGVVLAGEVIVGKENKLSPKEQGQKARGELDENNKLIPNAKLAEADKLSLTKGAEAGNDARTDKEKALDIKIEERLEYLEKAGDVSAGRRRIENEEPLYRGQISCEAVASATGQKVSVVFDQAEPTTEDGLFHSFLAYHPSARRDSFKVDAENEIDPTLRTYLEK